MPLTPRERFQEFENVGVLILVCDIKNIVNVSQEVRAQMEVMEDKDKHMVTESTNRKKLLEEVEALVVSFSCLLDTTLFVCLFPFPFR